jgi:hypothetical protein
MQYRVRIVPCVNGSECRWSDCIYGHVCQSNKCVGKEVETCSLKEFHHVDPTTVQWVKGEDMQRSMAYDDVFIDQLRV